MVLWPGRPLSNHRLHFILTGLSMVSGDLLDHGHIVLRSPEFIVKFSVMQRQRYECSELCD